MLFFPLLSLLSVLVSPLTIHAATLVTPELQHNGQVVLSPQAGLTSDSDQTLLPSSPLPNVHGTQDDDQGLKHSIEVESQKITYGHINRTLSSGREYVLNVPQGYEHGVGHPLVLSFHGAGGNSSRQEILSQLSLPQLRIANLPFLSAFPQGVNNTDWNMTHIWKGAVYANQTVDDIQFVKDIIADISSNYTLDASRLYATGKSNGGGFTSLLACRRDTASIFAAFAPVSPALYQEALAFHSCDPGRAVPIFHSHGIDDNDTLFYGRSKESNWLYGPEPDVRIWRARWALRNGHPAPARTNTSSLHGPSSQGQGGTDDDIYGRDLPRPNKVFYPHVNVTEEVWDLGKAEVRAISVKGLGHSWPSREGLDRAGSPNNTATFDFTQDHLIDFFSRHTLPEEYLNQ